MSTPKNWPPSLPYLSKQQYSKTLPPATLSALKTPTTDQTTQIHTIPQCHPLGPSTLVRITPITLPSHPANGQSGLFATKDLKPGTFILRYLGLVHSSLPVQRPGEERTGDQDVQDPHAHSNYDLSLDRDLAVGIDADKMGNEARFINDYRGVGERPNAEFREVWDDRGKERGIGVFVLPERKDGGKKGKGGIKKGEEVLVSYGKGFWGARRESGE